MKKKIRRIKKCSGCGASHSKVKVDILKKPELVGGTLCTHSFYCSKSKRLVYISF